MLEETCSGNAALLLCKFYWYSGSLERARTHVEKIMRDSPTNNEAKCLFAWLMISQHDDDYGISIEGESDDALDIFESILETEQDLEVENNLICGSCCKKFRHSS